MESIDTINTLSNAHTMNAFESIYVLHSIGGRLDVQWGFFISIHMALLGGIIYVDRPLNPVEKIVTLFVYGGFAVLNYIVATKQSLQVLASYQQLEALAMQAGENAQAMLAYYGQTNQSSTWDSYYITTIVVHVVMAFVVIISIVMDNAKRK